MSFASSGQKLAQSLQPVSTLYVEKGVCYALLGYDVGLSIDLDEAERCIVLTKQRETIKHKHPAPRYFEYTPSPLRVMQEIQPIALGGYSSDTKVDAVIYDFGAISVSYRIPLVGSFSSLLDLSENLEHNPLLLADSRRRVETLLETIRRAVVKPNIADCVEEYAIFQIESLTTPCPVRELVTKYGQEIAQLLRAERHTLSDEEVDDALICRIAFGPEDMTIIDWNAALVFDVDADDVLAVLEFANMELLEMRYLDQQLDKALDEAYEALSKSPWTKFRLLRSSSADLRRIAQLQVDSALLFEGVNNALKLLGDQYLARVYRLISQRFHLAEWDASIMRKLQTLESIYEKISDQATTRRMEVLEWIIILLIALSILLPFFPGFPGH